MANVLDGQLSALDLMSQIEEAEERSTRTLRNGLMLDVTDPEKIDQYAKDWRTVNPWPSRSPFYGFRHPVWESVKSIDSHAWATFFSDIRCVCPIGYKNGPRIHDCLCVGDWYQRIYCYTCEWWGEIHASQNKAEAEASAQAHVEAAQNASAPPFTVHEDYPGKKSPCGFCGVIVGIGDGNGGVKGRLPDDRWCVARICAGCIEKHGHPDISTYSNLKVTP